ncbi:hypothetical protein QRB36_17550 [Mycobacterium marseillense]|uniref:hypothetical protein n=1 Tax=Mycobacterium marseillense TaxID=701042 RepID=UPI0025941375|nr:hypothetical protein [Mycobacterium marseillense]MDM3975975.1 hypothetical protein [Mycobacterium marseillense]
MLVEFGCRQGTHAIIGRTSSVEVDNPIRAGNNLIRPLTGGPTIDFLASVPFRAIVLPFATAVVIIIARLNVRRDDSKEKFFEVFAVGPDLLIAAIVAVPAFIVEKAITFKNNAGSLDKGKFAAEIGSLGTSGYWYGIVFCLALIGFTLERPAKKMRLDGTWVKAVFIGVLIPVLIGATALAATFGLAR